MDVLLRPRRFFLQRHYDVSGVSGEGLVAWGTEYPNGKVTVVWCVPGMPQSVVIYDSLDEVVEINGHNGATKIMILDDPWLDWAFTTHPTEYVKVPEIDVALFKKGCRR